MMKKNEKRIPMSLLIALIGFPQISETIYTPSLPDVVKGLMTNAHLVEATLAIYFLGFALGVFLWGSVSDKIGRRNTMLTGLMIYLIGTFACGKAASIQELLIMRFVQAFGASVGSVITQTILRDVYEGIQRVKLFSIISGALAFSPAIGPLIGGFISQFWGWRANFWFLAIQGIFLLIWTFFYLPETLPVRNHHSSSKLSHLFSKMMTSKVFWGHVILIGSTNSILFGFYQEAPFLFIERLGISPSHYGFIGILISSALILASRFSFQKSAHFSTEYFIQAGSIFILLGGFGFTFVVASGLFELRMTGLAIGLIALFSVFFGIGLIIPNSLSTALKPFQNAAGTAGSIFGVCYYCFIASETWLMSLMHDGSGLPLPLYISALALILLVGSKMIRSPSQKYRQIF